MAKIPDEIVQRVRDAHDIAELVGRTVPLKRAGGRYKALCPFHEEKTPSFTVNPQMQIFHCFGCGKSGDAFTWLVETQGLTFPEAVRALAAERSIPVPDTGPAEPRRDDERRDIRRALELAQRFFVHHLATEPGAAARHYLAKRGYDEAAVARFGLGFAPASFEALLAAAQRRRMAAGVLHAAGLVKRRERPGSDGRRHYDTFRNRIIFPIHDWKGQLVTFAGRAMDPDEPAKYLNGPETLVFKKSQVLYALDRAKHAIHRAREAVLMEGYTDVLMCHLHGIDRAVAGMGTAFTERQARLLARFADRVTLMYDADEAGQRAAERTLEVLLGVGLEVRIATLPSGRDVDEVLLEEGAEAVQTILAGARDVLTFKLDALAARHDLATPRGRAEASSALLDTLAWVRNPTEQQLWIKQVAERLGGDRHGSEVEGTLRRDLAARLSRRRPRARPEGTASSGGGRPNSARTRGDGAAPAGRPAGGVERQREAHRAREEVVYLAGVFLDGRTRDAVFRAVGPEEFTVPVLGRIYNACLELYERGAPCDRRALADRFHLDPDALAALAELPEDPTLVEQVQSQIAFLERQRASHERQEQIRAQLAAAAAGRSVVGDPAAEDQPAEDLPIADRPEHDTDGPPPGPRAGAEEVDPGLPEIGSPFDEPVLDGPDGTCLYAEAPEGFATDEEGPAEPPLGPAASTKTGAGGLAEPCAPRDPAKSESAQEEPPE